jgi:hypothetical protein
MLEWTRIKDKLSNPFIARSVARKVWSGLTTAEEVRHAAGILQDRGWIKSVEMATDRLNLTLLHDLINIGAIDGISSATDVLRVVRG